MAKCKSCDEPVFWAKTEGGKMMLVNSEPQDNGNLRLEWRGVEDRHGNKVPTVIYDTSERNLFNEDVPRYLSHFASCPARKFYRKLERRSDG